jgi:hypothetical protein
VVYAPEVGFVGLIDLTYAALDTAGDSSEPASVRIYVTDPDRRWQNPDQSVDVDASGLVTPLDALLVINRLGTALPTTAGAPPFVDVNGDNQVSPLDALLVINRLGNPTSPSSSTSSASESVPESYWVPRTRGSRDAKSPWSSTVWINEPTTVTGREILTVPSARGGLTKPVRSFPSDTRGLKDRLGRPSALRFQPEVVDQVILEALRNAESACRWQPADDQVRQEMESGAGATRWQARATV